MMEMMELLNPVVNKYPILLILHKVLTYLLNPDCDAKQTSLLALHLAPEHSISAAIIFPL